MLILYNTFFNVITVFLTCSLPISTCKMWYVFHHRLLTKLQFNKYTEHKFATLTRDHKYRVSHNSYPPLPHSLLNNSEVTNMLCALGVILRTFDIVWDFAPNP